MISKNTYFMKKAAYLKVMWGILAILLLQQKIKEVKLLTA